MARPVGLLAWVWVVAVTARVPHAGASKRQAERGDRGRVVLGVPWP